MRYESAARFRQALERRLRDRSRATGSSLIRLRKTVVFERLLARLAVAARGRWTLKGALALDFRLRDRSRTTKDMDLVRHDNEEAAVGDLIEAASLDRRVEESRNRRTDRVLTGLGGLRERLRAATWHAREEFLEDLDRLEDLILGPGHRD